MRNHVGRLQRPAELVWRAWWTVLLLLIVVTADMCVAQDTGVANTDEMRRRLGAGWRHLRELDMRSKTYEVTLDRKDPGTERTISVRRVKVDSAAGYWLVEGEGHGGTFVVARNPNYAFTIRKNRGAKEWILQALVPDEVRVSELEKEIFGGDNSNACVIYPLSTTFRGTPLPELVNDKGFEITGVKRAPAGRLAVQFAWTYIDNGQPRDVKRAVCEGEMLVNPGLSCAVEEWSGSIKEVTGRKYPVRMKWSFAQERNEPENARCLAIKEEYGNTKHSYVFFDNYNMREVARDAFRLSQYGIPEPRVEGKRARFLWVLGAGFGLLGVGILFRCSAKKRSRSISAAAKSQSSL